ncbi:hypothetical protein GUJ93_ZPchr0010g9314 [Zizania palustris]|uniref:Uncharacterized protein n=1 Tax=Zizania palustris TaxID=103762 RepID=A0A8J6BIN6_ZIZPA|nr:hypothetical protein GUJ93_ZPchr0010g9314 [Zizania palustris]
MATWAWGWQRWAEGGGADSRTMAEGGGTCSGMAARAPGWRCGLGDEGDGLWDGGAGSKMERDEGLRDGGDGHKS